MKRYLFINILLLPIFIFGYKVTSSQLFIDVLILKDSSITIYGEDFEISELNSPFVQKLSGTYNFKISNLDSEINYDISSKKQFPNSYSKTINRLVWQNNKLENIEDTIFFSNSVFQHKANAIKYKNSNNILGNIQENVANDCQMLVEGNEDFSISLPCYLTGKISIKINNEYQVFESGIYFYSSKDNIMLVAQLPLQEYLFGVVANELGNSSNVEALKAQTVAARTKAIKTIIQNYSKSNLFDLDSTTKFQVFKSSISYNPNIIKAVCETDREILVYQNQIIDAVFSSCCGGKTEDNNNVWQSAKLPYLSSVNDNMRNIDLTKNSNARNWIKKKTGANCAYHSKSKNWEKKLFNWEKSISNNTIANSVDLEYIKKITVLKRGSSGRILSIKLSGYKSSKLLNNQSEIRKIFGNSRSSLFYVKTIGEDIVIEGKGNGHGVGMCQTGMLNQIRDGKAYKEVLKFYYRGCEIIKLNFQSE